MYLIILLSAILFFNFLYIVYIYSMLTICILFRSKTDILLMNANAKTKDLMI